MGRSQRGFDLEHTAGLLEEGAVVCQETDLLWLLLLIEALIGGAVVVVVLFLLLAPIQSVGIRLLLSARLGVQVLYPQEFPCREKHTHTLADASRQLQRTLSLISYQASTLTVARLPGATKSNIWAS